MVFISANYNKKVIRHVEEKKTSLQVLEVKPITFFIPFCGKPNKKLFYTHDKTKVIFISNEQKKAKLKLQTNQQYCIHQCMIDLYQFEGKN